MDRDLNLASPPVSVLETQNLQRSVFQTNVKLIRTVEGEFIAAYRTDTQENEQDWGTIIIKTKQIKAP